MQLRVHLTTIHHLQKVVHGSISQSGLISKPTHKKMDIHNISMGGHMDKKKGRNDERWTEAEAIGRRKGYKYL